MALALLPLVGITGVTASYYKRKQTRRLEASKNAFSQKYPIVEDVAILESTIVKAEQELKALSVAPTKNASQRRIKTQTMDVLSKWIITLKDELRDTKAELSLIASQTPSVAPTPTLPTTTQATPLATPLATNPTPIVAGEVVQVSQNLATPTKKGVNWILIGGILVGGYLIYKISKK
jgi:hypothetical protein